MACDCPRLCEGGVAIPDNGEGEENTADLGLPAAPMPAGVGDDEPVLEKGLLRLTDMLTEPTVMPAYRRVFSVGMPPFVAEVITVVM